MESSSKVHIGSAQENSSDGSEIMGAQLVAESLKKQVSKNYNVNL